MNNRQVEKKISEAFESVRLDQLDSILAECAKQEKKVMFVEEDRNSFSWMSKALALAATFILVFGIMFGTFFVDRSQDIVAATISLDVNPSIEIMINKDERVIDVVALNDDALVILDDMDFKGSDLKVTINALIGSLVRNGYINELTNSILVSVQDSDDLQAENLEKELISIISDLIDDGSVLAQQVKADDAIKEISEVYGITLGKAQMIKELADNSTMYDYEDLAGLTINELNLLSKDLENSRLQRNGRPSDKAYIGTEKAKAIAFEDLGVEEAQVYLEKIELDYENRRMVYEVEFTCSNIEYEYVIDAINGEILRVDVEGTNYDYLSGESVGKVENSSSTLISEAQAKSIALTDAGVSESEVNYYRIEKEYDDGVVKYEIDFYAGNVEYDYDIDAVNGTILKREKEYETSQSESTDTQNTITIEEAKRIAMNHASVSDVYDMEADLDENKYEITFRSNGYEYDYDIGLDGTILKAEKEKDD